MILTVYYWGNDPDGFVSDFSFNPSSDLISSEIMQIYIYDNNYNKIGYIIRTGKYIYDPIDNKPDEYRELCILDFTIYFYDNINTISFSQVIDITRNGTLYIPYVPVRSLITNCTGDIYNKTGTVELMAFDNKVRSRMITITLN